MPEDLADLDAAVFEAPPRDPPAPAAADTGDGEMLVVNLDVFEGPLDLLLTLARTQKVDLAKISVLRLAEQYLAFIAEARRLRLELAADYLVMAAWLAWLKSRLLLPPPHDDDEPSGEELAARLAFQLERLEAMRRAAAELMARPQLGRDVFPRGRAEAIVVQRELRWTATLAELLGAYARVRARDEFRPLPLERPAVMTMEMALERLERQLGVRLDWLDLAAFLPAEWRGAPERRRSALAGFFAASLELARQGRVELRQEEPFAPLMLRRRRPNDGEPATGEAEHG